ncbi:tRNA uridine-5-carboxymethylaminomethyl(34) synthesis GTPase MnmE [bacterium]|nr:tRNA uridine-5-carboxymethylaminomethyl(34) synthesis GTPase MnmE [bacterium]
MQAAFDTIAAIATARGRGAIGVLRLSGPMTESVMDKLFSSASGRKTAGFGNFKLRFGDIKNSSGEPIDSGLAFFSRAPKSYTGEDYAEIFCHGNPVILEKVLESALHSGAIIAPPGEFTRRAFLNGKMDLTQSEGVDELIRASSEKHLGAAWRLQRGDLKAKLEPISEKLSRTFAHIQGAIEFSDDVADDAAAWKRSVSEAIGEIKELLKNAEVSAKLRDGLIVAIAGKPNAGKSSLFNALIKEDRALVTKVAGTTRDTISAELEVSGLNVTLLDTAGLRKAKGTVEALGVERAIETLEKADAIIWTLDGTKKTSAAEEKEIKKWQALKPVLVLTTKSDLLENKGSSDTLLSSAVSGEGLDKVREFLKTTAEKALCGEESVILLKARHSELLKSALENLSAAESGFASGKYLELCADEIGSALSSLWEVTGKKTPNEILDIIFGEFCVGK